MNHRHGHLQNCAPHIMVVFSSHHIFNLFYTCRLGFCSREDSRRWFITHEAALFKWRFQMLTTEEKTTFIQQDFPHLQLIGEEEKICLQKYLIAASGPACLSDAIFKVLDNSLTIIKEYKVFLIWWLFSGPFWECPGFGCKTSGIFAGRMGIRSTLRVSFYSIVWI